MDTGVEDGLAAGSHHDGGSRAALPRAVRPVLDLRPVLAALAAFGLAYYLALTRLVRGDLLNSYPFISADGFDWLVEGFAVARWFDGVAIPEFPAARSPGFVSITFADYQLGVDGAVLFGVISVAVVAGLAVLLLLAWWERVPRYQAAVVVLVLAVSPLGYYRMWILSDQVATALMVTAAVGLYPYVTRGNRMWLLLAAVAAGLGGATQLYGLVGYLVAGGWCVAVSVWRRKPDFVLAGALLFAPAMAVVLSKAWLGQVPHTGVPLQLSLFELNFDMLGFYANAWSFAFAPLVPLVGVLMVYRWREVLASPLPTGYWLAVLALLGSTFFYQVEEFRFTLPTSMMLGVAVMATLQGERRLPSAPALWAATATLAVLIGILLAPGGYVKPKWSEVALDPSDTYFARLLSADPVDRFSLGTHCQSDRLCADVPLPAGIADHDRALFGIYRHLVNADSSTTVASYYQAIYDGFFEERNTNDCCVADTSLPYGLPGDRPVAGDWDGLPAALPPDPKTGSDTPGAFRDGRWVLSNSNSAGPVDMEFGFGRAGDLPAVGDWDGDGIDTVGVFRAGGWLLRNSNSEGSADLEFEFGRLGDVPVAGDWDGDGIDTVGVYRRGRWLLRNSNTAGPSDLSFDFGGASDRPVSGDWDGDAVDTVGTFSQGLWRLRNSNAGGSADLEFHFGAYAHLPVTGDWNDNGIDTVGILR